MALHTHCQTPHNSVVSQSSFSSRSSKHHKSQTSIAIDLKFLYNTHHLSRVMCHMSCVMSHLSSVFFLHIGGASLWRVCYQRVLPRLVFKYILSFETKSNFSDIVSTSPYNFKMTEFNLVSMHPVSLDL